jgi:hypothetical protein
LQFDITVFDPMANNHQSHRHLREANKRAHCLWILLLVLRFSQYKADNGALAELRLSASGGGWRAMFTNLGFFNAFKLAGIIDIENQTTAFTGISSNSGAAWFLGQVAFSQQFLNVALPNNPNTVYNFTFDWITAYQDFLNDIEESSEPAIKACMLLKSFGDSDSICQLLVHAQFQWGKYSSDMLQATASKTYGDAALNSRELIPENRLTLFQNTDLMFQMSLSPVSKVQKNRLGLFRRRMGQFLSYVGPSSNNTSVFSSLIACQYTVTAQKASFRYAVEPSMMPLRVYTGPAPRQFQFSDWEKYALYSDSDGRTTGNSMFTDLPPSKSMRSSATLMKAPFRNGIGTFDQVLGASSAFLSDQTGAIPSFYAQKNSFDKFLIENSSMPNLGKMRDIHNLEQRLNVVYSSNFINDLALCSNWPDACLVGNVRLIDGGYTDGACKYFEIEPVLNLSHT